MREGRAQNEPASGRYRGTSLIRNRLLVGPYSRPMPRNLGGSQGAECFLMGEVALQVDCIRGKPYSE